MAEEAGGALDADSYDRWRLATLRDTLTALSSHHANPKRRRLMLAGKAELGRDADGGLVAKRRDDGPKKTIRWRHFKGFPRTTTDPETGSVRRAKGEPPGRFVVDRFVDATVRTTVLRAVEQTEWFGSRHTFETVPLSSYLTSAAGAATARQLQQLRDTARICLCEALQVEAPLYHTHATLTRTRPTAAEGAPQYSDDDALQLFEAVQLKDAGNEKYRAGMYEEAIGLYTAALEQLPDHMRQHAEVVLILNNRAAAHNQLQNYRQVVVDTTAALELEPGNVKALMRRGFAYEAIERYAPALADMEAVGRLAPRAVEAIRAAGRLRGLVKKLEEIQAEEEAQAGGVAHPPSLDSWEAVGESSGSAEAVRGGGGKAEGSTEQFSGPHADMASVLHYDYSAVLYLTSGGGAGFEGGELVFCDGDADRKVVPRAGRLVGFSSVSREHRPPPNQRPDWGLRTDVAQGLENVHRIEEVGEGGEARVVLAMWFTADVRHREDDSDPGYEYAGESLSIPRL